MSQYCSSCLSGGRATGTPSGTIITLHDTPTYIASPNSTPQSPSQSTIILFTDGFGMKLANNKLLADDYASATGFRVLVPDLLPGSGMDPRVLNLMDAVGAPTPWWDVWGYFVKVWCLLQVATHFIPFFFKADGNQALPKSVAYARKVKADLPPGAKLGAAGFCWGGFQTVYLCAYPAVEGGDEGLLDVQFCAHPSAIGVPEAVVEAIKKFKVRFSWAHGGDDFMMKTSKVEECEAVLRETVGDGKGAGGVYYEIQHYPGCNHGFAIRAKPGSKIEADGADRAKEQAIEWFKKHL